MKISQAQYFEIEEFFKEKCRLVETEFIQEMTDHFIDAIEIKLTESIQFDAAINSTIEDFGGQGAIQKMEWQYRKGFVKKQLRVLWALEKSQFSRQRIIRTSIVSFMITALCIYLALYTKDMTNSYDFVGGILTGSSIVPAFTLPIFLLRRYIKWLDIFGVIKSQTVVRVCINYLLFVISILLSLAITESGIAVLANALMQSFVWTILAISCFSFFEYSQKFEENYWFVTK